MPLLDADTYLRHLRADSARFREVLAGCDPAARVPACPDWDAADLLWHLTEVQWFWSEVVRLRPAPPDDEAARPGRPSTYDGLLAAFDEHSAALATALGDAEPAEAAWHWSPVQTVLTSHRRQAHEALIHRLDAEQAAGVVTELDPVIAADGVAEALDVMYGGEPPAWGSFEPGASVVGVRLSDVGEDLWVRPGTFHGTDPGSGKNYDGPHLLLVEAPDEEPAATITGRAVDVDAWLWKRRDASGIERVGDPAVLAAFDAAVSPALD